MNLVGKKLAVYDIAVSRDLPIVNEYEIESVELYNYIQLKDYPSKIYLNDKEEWESLLKGKKAWIHALEVFCILR